MLLIMVCGIDGLVCVCKLSVVEEFVKIYSSFWLNLFFISYFFVVVLRVVNFWVIN